MATAIKGYVTLSWVELLFLTVFSLVLNAKWKWLFCESPINDDRILSIHSLFRTRIQEYNRFCLRRGTEHFKDTIKYDSNEKKEAAPTFVFVIHTSHCLRNWPQRKKGIKVLTLVAICCCCCYFCGRIFLLLYQAICHHWPSSLR